MVIQNCNLFAEESKILDNYIELGQPSCYVEYCMLCGARYAISDCHVINVHVHVYNMSNLITRTSGGYHYNCNELGGYMARFTQFPIMITRSTIIYDIISLGAAGSSIYA